MGLELESELVMAAGAISMVSPHRATLRSAEGVDCALPDGKVPQKSDSLKSLGLEPRLSDFSQKWATISGCIFFRVPRFRVHASERENKTHTHTTRAKKGPVWLFLKRAPGGIKKGGVEIPLTAQSDPQVGLLAVHSPT